MARWFHGALCLLLCTGAIGCRSYSEKLEPVRYAVAAGDPQAGLERIDELLKLDAPTDLPDKWDGEVPLAVLERATLLQALGSYQASRVNFSAAEGELEFLDLSRDAGGKISEYLISASAKKYRTTPVEKLFLNSLNLLNYLALGDLSGARVEARRWRLMRDYLRDHDKGQALTLCSAFGAFMAGYTFEKSGKPEQALRYYAEALRYAELPFLGPWLASLGQKHAYRSQELQNAMDQAGPSPNLEGTADLMVIAMVGQVPYRAPKRVPVGLAVGLAAHFFVGSPELLERGATKFVNYPELVVSSTGPTGAQLRVGGQAQSLNLVANASLAVQDEFDRLRPRIVAAALSRTLSRAALAYGVEEGTNAAQRGDDSGGLLGFLLGSALEVSLVAADKPDTRSWSVLPGYFYVTRMALPAGKQQVELQLMPSGTTYTQQVELKAGESRVLLLNAYIE